MPDFNKIPYAKWLEESLQNFVGKPVQSICICTKFEDGTVGSGYWDCSISDKLIFAGFLQQDAMLDTMRENGIIDDGDVEEEEESDA